MVRPVYLGPPKGTDLLTQAKNSKNLKYFKTITNCRSSYLFSGELIQERELIKKAKAPLRVARVATVPE